MHTGLRQLFEELPGNRGLADPGRTAKPQDRNEPVGHLITAGSAGSMYPVTIGSMIGIMAAIFGGDVFAGQMLFPPGSTTGPSAAVPIGAKTGSGGIRVKGA